jgi:hypothetical protein
MLCALLARPALALTANIPARLSTGQATEAVQAIDETAYTGVLLAVVEPRTGLLCADNPVNNIDPTGLKTFLILYGQNYEQGDYFKGLAESWANNIKTWWSYDPWDKVVLYYTPSVTRFRTALIMNDDIYYIAYFGHGGESALYLSFAKGKEYNLSPDGGPAGEAKESTSVNTLPRGNVRDDGWIDLFSCRGAMASPAGTSIAQAFADRFHVPAQGAGAGVGYYYDGEPMIRN